MNNFKQYESKTLEEAIKKATEDLNCETEDLIIKENFIEGKLFKSSKYTISVIKKEDVKEYLKNFFKTLGNLMNIVIESEIKIENNIYNINLISDNNAILIGKEGKTINSIQLLVKQLIQNQFDNMIKINLDASNYKYDQTKRFERNIKNIAKEVLRTKVDSQLDPMNSYTRRIVHTIISEYENLATESIGEGKDRHVVIKYIEK